MAHVDISDATSWIRRHIHSLSKYLELSAYQVSMWDYVRCHRYKVFVLYGTRILVYMNGNNISQYILECLGEQFICTNSEDKGTIKYFLL